MSNQASGDPKASLTNRGRLRAHARERALERYGVVLTDDAMRDMRAQIRSGQAKVVQMRSKTFGIFLVYWADADRDVPVFYHGARRQIVSVLPPEAGDMNNAGAEPLDESSIIEKQP